MQAKSKTIVKNTGLLYFRMAITMLASLYTSRVVLDALGVVDYGIYNVVGGLTTMFLFINSSMSVATSRFFSYEIGKGNNKRLSIVYSQAVIIHYVIALFILILIETVGLWFLYNKLVIPESRLIAAEWVLHVVTVVSVLNILSTPDLSLIIANERMSSFAYISIYEVFFKLLISYLLTIWNNDRLILYALLLMIVQISVRLIYYLYCKAKFVESRGKIVFSKTIFNEMIVFAGWNLLGNLAVVTIDQGINILLNVFFGPVVNAARGIANQTSNYAMTFVSNIRMAVNPQITKSYVNRDKKYMFLLIRYSSISCYYVLLLICIPLFFFVEDLLEIWLVEVPQYTAIFFKLMLIYLIVNSLSNPLIIAIHSTGKIVKFQIVEGLLMLLTLPFAYILLELGLSPWSVYIAQIIVAVISQMGRMYIILPAIGMKLSCYLITIVKPCVEVTLFSVAFPSIAWALGTMHIQNETIQVRMMFSLLSLIWSLLTISYIGLKPEERNQIITIIKTKMNSR